MIRAHDEPLPPFRPARDIIAAVADAMRPPSRVSVSQAAERHRQLKNPGGGYSGPWRNDLAPYITEIMDATVSRQVDMVVIVGPTQFGKTEVFLNHVAHAVKYRPANILMFQPTRDLAVDFAERRLERGCILASRSLADELGTDRSDDKALAKVFRNGTTVSIAWPVGSQFASRPVPTVLIDERDSMPDDIRGEGDPVALAQRRTETFGRNAMIVVASSPKRPDATGIMPLYEQGDRRLWHVPCVECGDYFAPGFDAKRRPTMAHLVFPRDVDPDVVRRETRLGCPHCGALIEERHKAAMNARGVWLCEGQTIAADGTIAGEARASRVRSYWFSGLASRTKSWGAIAAEFVEATRALEERRDETQLKAFWNTTLGAPYRPQHAAAAAIEPDELRKRVEPFPLGVVPAWASFVTAAVDVQGSRFDVMVVAWGAGGISAPVALFQVFKTMDGGDERLVDPANRLEDWDLLCADVLDREWPIEGVERTARVLVMAVDTGGAAGVTGKAYEWWSGLRSRSIGELPAQRRVMLIKGGTRRDAPMIARSLIETDQRGRRLKHGIALSTINVAVLKDMVDARLRTEPGKAGSVRLSHELPDRYFDEVTAEVKSGDAWQKRRARNEAFDLSVYNLAAFVRLGGLRIDWSNPPDWARRLAPAQAQLEPAPAPAPSPVEAVVPAPPARADFRTRPRRFGGFVTNWRN